VKNLIVRKPEKIKPKEYATFDIRVTKNQAFIFREWCKNERIIMVDTLHNCIKGLLNGKYVPQMIVNNTNTAKYGIINIRGSVDDKNALNSYCVKNGLNVGDVIFSILEDLKCK